ncbi:replication initiation protein [Ramlibacter sp. AN1133]|uniref:replication initiation protein n=1 Tax=Ramlibacter sp. AN1133 TaxID=3133429 RepID=UPI0030C4623E
MASRRRATEITEAQIGLFKLPETPDAFRKAVQVVHSKPKAPMSMLQRKLANVWLKNAMANPADEQGWYSIPVRVMAVDAGFDSNNREYLKQSAEQLMRIVFEWDVVAPQNKRVLWKASVLFPEVEIRPDVLRYQISRQLRDHVLDPEIYALIDMNVVRRFRKTASIPIYEHCVRFERIKLTAEMQWQEFRDMILGETSEAKAYAEYKYFKQKVLNPCIAEINSESNHMITLLETKIGRRINTVRFTVERKAEPAVEGAISDEENLELVGEMVRMGVPQSEAKKLCRNHTAKEVRTAIDFTKKRAADKRASKLEKPAAYFRQALAQGWGMAEEAKVKGESHAEEPDQLEQEFALHRMAEADGYFKELELADQTRMIDAYNAQQEVPQLRVGKKASKASQTAFFRWLARETWGEPTPQELLKFAKQKLRKRA